MKAKIVPLPTSAEITRRLRIVSELRNLCLSLGRARPVVTQPPETPSDHLRSADVGLPS